MPVISISNLAAPVPLPGAAPMSLSSFPAQKSLPFSTLLLAGLNSSGNAGKAPAPNKPRDSAREPNAGPSAPKNPLSNPFQLDLPIFSPLPTAQAPIVLTSGAGQVGEASRGLSNVIAHLPEPFSDVSSVSQSGLEILRQGSDATNPEPLPAAELSDGPGSSPVQTELDPTAALPLPVKAETPVVPPIQFGDPFLAVATDQSSVVSSISPEDSAANRGFRIDTQPEPTDARSNLSIAHRQATAFNAETPSTASRTADYGPSEKSIHLSLASPSSSDLALVQNTMNMSTIRALQGARSELQLKNVQILDGNPLPGVTEQSPQERARGQTSASNPTDASPMLTTTPLQGPTAVVGATTAPRELLQSPVVNAQPVSNPNVTSTSKSISNDTSNGTESNDSNAKSDHSLNSALVHADGTGLVQSLDTATANAGNSNHLVVDPAVVMSDIRSPTEQRMAGADAKPDGSALQASQSQAATVAAGADQPTVSGARMVDHPGQTEIRIEMQAGSLGTVELRAHVSGDQIGASIAVEHHDAQAMLVSDLPALHSALTEKNLRVNALSVSQSMAASTGGGQSGNAGQRGFLPSHSRFAYAPQEEISTPVSETQMELPDLANASALSVLA